MSNEAIAFVDALKAIDYSLAMWAEVRIDGGASLADTKAKLREAMRLVGAERQEPRPIGDLVEEDIDVATSEGRHYTEPRRP